MTDKAYVILNWEQDWDDWHIYFHISDTGKLVKYDILTDTVYEYEIERVVH